MRPKAYYQKHKAPRLHVQVWEDANGPVPEGFVIDHIDGDIHNNALSNLRVCTVSENICNSKLFINNKTGIKGVSWDTKRNCYRGSITKSGKTLSKRGSLLEVCAWAITTRRELHGDFARFR